MRNNWESLAKGACDQLTRTNLYIECDMGLSKPRGSMTPRTCKKCGGEMTVTRGRDYQAFECRTCHFVIIEAPPGAAHDAADAPVVEHAD